MDTLKLQQRSQELQARIDELIGFLEANDASLAEIDRRFPSGQIEELSLTREAVLAFQTMIEIELRE